MATEVLMPKLGLTMTEGTIDEWKKNVGDTVKKGEILFSVETDKLTNDVESEADGVLLKILVPAGETVACRRDGGLQDAGRLARRSRRGCPGRGFRGGSVRSACSSSGSRGGSSAR